MLSLLLFILLGSPVNSTDSLVLPYNYTLRLILRRPIVFFPAVWNKAAAEKDFLVDDWFHLKFDFGDLSSIEARSKRDLQSAELATFNKNKVLQKDEYIVCNQEERYQWKDITITHLESLELVFLIWLDHVHGNHSVLGIRNNSSTRFVGDPEAMIQSTAAHLTPWNISRGDLIVTPSMSSLTLPSELYKIRNCVKPYGKSDSIVQFIYSPFTGILPVIVGLLLVFIITSMKTNQRSNRVYPFNVSDYPE